MIEEGLLADHQPSGGSEDLGKLIVHRCPAAGAAALHTPDNQHPIVSEVDDLLELVPKLSPFGDPPPFEPHAAFETAIHGGVEAEPDELRRHYQLDLRVVERDGRFDVVTVQGLEAHLRGAPHKHPSQPGARRQPEDRSGHKGQGTREPHGQALFQAAARLLSQSYRLAHHLHVLLLHRPRSISRIERALLPQPGGFEGFLAVAYSRPRSEGILDSVGLILPARSPPVRTARAAQHFVDA